MAGYTLGGGLSWFGRTYGWAADSVTAFDVVDADGPQRHGHRRHRRRAVLGAARRRRRLRDRHRARVRPAPGPAPVRRADAVAGRRAPRRCWTPSGEITADRAGRADRLVRSAALPRRRADGRRRRHLPGRRGRGTDLLAPAGHDRRRRSSDSRRSMPVAELGGITAEPTDPGPGLSRGELLTGLDDDAAKALLADADRPAAQRADPAPGRGAGPAVRQPARPADRAVRPLPVRRPADATAERRSRRASGISPALPPSPAGASRTPTSTRARARRPPSPRPWPACKISSAVTIRNVFRSNFPVLA